MNVSRTAKVLSAALPLFALSPCALAVQEAVTTGPVVVTAAGYEQDTTEAPASVSVITHKELMTKPVSDLGQAVGDGRAWTSPKPRWATRRFPSAALIPRTRS